MRRIFWTNQFKKDFKRAQTQGKDIKALKEIVSILAEGKKLPIRCVDHPLRGEWNYCRDCHIKGDWVLIYRIEGNMLVLERVGSHSELFK
ncbi:MAG: type II toxin-antitoxin system YafQ family toxin [Sedimentisphaerales bacterium]|nr:type II toxin-antitoxin system YafQ family toxin [Sedimentisphaerales bacterium]